MQLRADACAVTLAEAASHAAAIVAAANPQGTERESADAARRLAATVKAAAVATAEDTAEAAALVADAVTIAAAGVALTVSSAAAAVESEVAEVAAALQSIATATARQVAATIDARATRTASMARQAAIAAQDVEDTWDEDAGMAPAPAMTSERGVALLPLQRVGESGHRGQ
jgi:uncharacterized protein YqgV (UPF0045/DUF77 family)